MDQRTMTPEERKHKRKLYKIQVQGRRKKEIQEAKEKYWPKKKLTGSKVGLYYIYIMATVIQIFSMVAMWHLQDLSALGGMIAATVGEVFAYASYSAKSAKENTKGGIVYETAIKEQNEANTEPTEGNDDVMG